MTLWEYLKGRMRKHSGNKVFSDGTTYGELVSYVEQRASKYTYRNRLVCASGNSKIANAIEIFTVLASGNVAVPMDVCYGEKKINEIQALINADKTEYDQTAFIMFTSGTGGTQKGAMLSHDNIIRNLQMIEEYFAVDDKDRILIARPLVHIAVIIGELLYGLIKGATILFYDQPFLPQTLCRAIEVNKITVLCGTPTIMRNLIRANADLPLRVCAISGERLSPELAKAIAKAWNKTEFYNVYGLTEHSPRVSALLPQDFEKYLGSVGKPLKDVRTKIVGGELLIKSGCVMQGYYNDKKRTNAKIKDGWLHTGDMAHFDKDGYLYIDGRKDNMIIRSGLNIYPEEIENVAGACSGISACIVCGETDEIEGQRIVLRYCGDISEQELRKYLTAHLPPHLLPRIISREESLPVTPSGKTVRKC